MRSRWSESLWRKDFDPAAGLKEEGKSVINGGMPASGHTPVSDGPQLRSEALEPRLHGRSVHARGADGARGVHAHDDLMRRRVCGHDDGCDGVHPHANGRGHGRASCGGRNARGSARDDYVRANGDARVRVCRSWSFLQSAWFRTKPASGPVV